MICKYLGSAMLLKGRVASLVYETLQKWLPREFQNIQSVCEICPLDEVPADYNTLGTIRRTGEFWACCERLKWRRMV